MTHRNAEIHPTNEWDVVVEGDILDITDKEHTVHVKNIGGSGDPATLGGKAEVGTFEGKEYRHVGGGAWYPFKSHEERESWPYPGR
jgi:hypothetical protein